MVTLKTTLLQQCYFDFTDAQAEKRSIETNCDAIHIEEIVRLGQS